MKDETKEILNKLLEYFKESDINDFGYEEDKLISYEEAQILLDYITNLQDTLKDREEYCYGLETQLTNLLEENERLRSILMDSIETTNKAIKIINKEIERSNSDE